MDKMNTLQISFLKMLFHKKSETLLVFNKK